MLVDDGDSLYIQPTEHLWEAGIVKSTGKAIGMYNHISQMEPLYLARSESLEDLSREVVAMSAKLEGRLAAETLEEIRRLLQVVNSY